MSKNKKFTKKNTELLPEHNIEQDIIKAENTSNPEDNQAYLVTKKKQAVKKISINTENTEKLSFFNLGSDSIEKTSLLGPVDLIEDKISMDGADIQKKKSYAKTKTETISQIIKYNQNCDIKSNYSDSHFSLAFLNGRLLTPNVIFSALQYHKYDIFAYKKSWHVIISRELERLHAASLIDSTKGELPFFTDSVEVVVYRRAPTLVDEDAVSLMFKYIIDALKRDKKKNPYGVLADDNPKIIFKTEAFNEKGTHEVGIRLQVVPDYFKEQYSVEKILNKRTY